MIQGEQPIVDIRWAQVTHRFLCFSWTGGMQLQIRRKSGDWQKVRIEEIKYEDWL